MLWRGEEKGGEREEKSSSRERKGGEGVDVNGSMCDF